MKKFMAAGCAAVVLVFCATTGFASGGEAGGHDKLLDLLYRTINFCIVGFLIYKLAGKRIAQFLSRRSESIEEDLSNLDARREEAEKHLLEVEASIANLENEKASILAEAKSQGEAMREQIIAKANTQAEQIRLQAENAALQEQQIAVGALREAMAEQIVTAAEDLVKKQLKKKDHEDLINEYLKKVVLN